MLRLFTMIIIGKIKEISGYKYQEYRGPTVALKIIFIKIHVRLSLNCMKIDIRSFILECFYFFFFFPFFLFSFFLFLFFFCLDSKFRNKLFNKSDEFSKACYFQYLWLRQSALLIMSAPLALWTFRRPCLLLC